MERVIVGNITETQDIGDRIAERCAGRTAGAVAYGAGFSGEGRDGQGHRHNDGKSRRDKTAEAVGSTHDCTPHFLILRLHFYRLLRLGITDCLSRVFTSPRPTAGACASILAGSFAFASSPAGARAGLLTLFLPLAAGACASAGSAAAPSGGIIVYNY